MRRFFKKQSNNYTLYGALFGFCFPFFGTLIQSMISFDTVTFQSIINTQQSSHLLWIIDTAPFWLGLFARIAGIMNDRLNSTIDILKEKNNILNEDLSAAKIIQESFLPEKPGSKFCEISYKYKPMSDVSGDFLRIIKFHGESFGVFLGDVSGHGVSAALITSLTYVIINKICTAYAFKPSKLLDKMNSELLNYLPDNKYIAGLYGAVKRSKNKLEFIYARAGQCYPIVWRKKEKEATVLKSSGACLGVNENTKFFTRRVLLNKGDIIFLFTDGLVEVINSTNKELGYTGLIKIINSIDFNKNKLSEALDIIMNEIENDYQNKPYIDDKILTALKFK